MSFLTQSVSRQFSHSRLVRGPQPLIGCLPETCGRRGPERGETRTCTVRAIHYRMRPEHCAGVLVILEKLNDIVDYTSQ